MKKKEEEDEEKNLSKKKITDAPEKKWSIWSGEDDGVH